MLEQLLNPGGPPMTPGTVFVNVWNVRAAVSRVVAVRGGISSEPATNWETLEDDAIEAIEAQGGAVNLSGWYHCPPELAARAEWAEG
jgi:hypothetical protein